MAGFLSGPGFERMRQNLRQRCHEIWVIDCSPEGHQPEASTRIFQAVQQPVCIVIASRWRGGPKDVPAQVHWRALPVGHRDGKFDALAALKLDSPGWVDCPADERAPFLPASVGAWATYPGLEDFFDYNGSAVMPGRTWVIAPDADLLRRRWAALVTAAPGDKARLCHPHLRNGLPADKHVHKLVSESLTVDGASQLAVADETGPSIDAVGYGFRSFDRQWVLPDARLLNQPNPRLWRLASSNQMHLTAFSAESPTAGPALTITALVPDLHHYKGSFGGRVFPLWSDAAASKSNVRTANAR